MDNFHISRNFVAYAEGLFQNVLVSFIGDNVVYFITKQKQLCIAEGLKKLKLFDLTKELDSVVELKYIHFWHCIFIATRTKFIIADPSSGKISILHSPTDKLIHSSWNPSESCFIAVDEDNNLFSFSFGAINTELHEYQFVHAKGHLNDAVPNSVYVGWGSHNTQFKGIKKVEEKIIEYPQEYSAPIISWRGNGEQFVVNFWRDTRRYLKVFGSNLNPLFESEAYPNLLPPISFKGQGNFIACAAEHNGLNKIVIFEKNCLVKSEFFTNHVMGKIRMLQYHPELHFLAVYSECIEGTGFLSIYAYSNGHWYLKQHVSYPSDKKLISFTWTTCYDKNICSLNVLTCLGLEQIVLKLVFNKSKFGLIATIDGNVISFTNLADAKIPPPLSSFTLSFDQAVNSVTFNDTLNLCSVTLSDETLKHFTYKSGTLEECVGVNDIPSINELSEDIFLYSKEVMINNTLKTLSLNKNGDIVIDTHTIVCSNVLSIFIFNDYLLFTHASCRLYCIRLTSDTIRWDSVWNLDNFYFREIEQGAKIVSVVDTSEIILILPRGNLEIIMCRLISIDIIEKLLLENNWIMAIKEIRRQRLNWNLLIDLNPDRFFNHIDEFVEAAGTTSTLNAVVADFSSINCLTTIYSKCVPDRLPSNLKKKEVISKILTKLVSLNPILNLISIVLLQMRHFSLKSALYSICQAFELGKITECAKATKQILLHHHSMEIINESYSLYNIDFMAFIYACTSEDPKVFEPEIAKLRSVDPIELRFKMNEAGKHFASATKYLLRCNRYDEKFITTFITKHSTQKVAYETLSPKQAHFILVSTLFANFLSHRSRHNEAGMVLERAGLFEKALSHYQKALNWSHILILFGKVKLDENARKDILADIADMLVNERRLDEAVLLYEHYCGESEEAMDLLIENHKFHKALALARKIENIKYEEEHILPEIKKYRQELLYRISALRQRFSNYSSRLEEVRQSKANKLQNIIIEGDVVADDLNSEYGSVISRSSTVRSNSSLGSTLSARNRRKQEKKKLDLKQGGIYEDIALIRQLYMLIIQILDCGNEVSEVCASIIDDQSFKYAKILHDNLSENEELVRNAIPKIWSDEFMNAANPSDPKILAIIENRDELDTQFRTPPDVEKLASEWKLLIFSNN